MSVKTTADAKLDRVRRSIADAVEDLSGILIEECWGHDEYNADFCKEMEKAFRRLRKMKTALGPPRYFEDEVDDGQD